LYFIAMSLSRRSCARIGTAHSYTSEPYSAPISPVSLAQHIYRDDFLCYPPTAPWTNSSICRGLISALKKPSPKRPPGSLQSSHLRLLRNCLIRVRLRTPSSTSQKTLWSVQPTILRNSERYKIPPFIFRPPISPTSPPMIKLPSPSKSTLPKGPPPFPDQVINPSGHESLKDQSKATTRPEKPGN
jgi:hypothetical protein